MWKTIQILIPRTDFQLLLLHSPCLQPYPKQNRRFVCGLRESCKALKAGKVKAVLLAPDIQLNRTDRPELRSEVLDSRVNDILKGCCKPGEPGVPVVFALSRKQIGQVSNFLGHLHSPSATASEYSMGALIAARQTTIVSLA